MKILAFISDILTIAPILVVLIVAVKEFLSSSDKIKKKRTKKRKPVAVADSKGFKSSFDSSVVKKKAPQSVGIGGLEPDISLVSDAVRTIGKPEKKTVPIDWKKAFIMKELWDKPVSLRM